jgi:hypothetical protein
MKRKLLLFVWCIAYLVATFIPVRAQPIYNQHNVVQDALTRHYDDSQPLCVKAFRNNPDGTRPSIITANFVDPDSPFNEWKANFLFADIILDVK